MGKFSLFCYLHLFHTVEYILIFLLLSNAFHGHAQSEAGEESRELHEKQLNGNSSNGEMSRFDEVMKMVMAISNAPGAQLAVAKGGQLKYFKAFGVANRDNGEPVTTHHIFRYNSISKVITGTAILKLVQEGKVSLEDKPFSFLENLHPPKGATVDKRLLNITVQNLLQHTGGWNRTSTGIDVFGIQTALYISQSLGFPPPPRPSEAIRFMKAIALDFDPGSAMEYSNFGYLILGRVIEKATGMNYGEYVQKHMFHPLGIRDIKLGQSMLEHLAHNEVRYYGINGEDAPFVSIFPNQGFVNSSYGIMDYRSSDSYASWTGSAGELVRFVDHIDGLRRPAVLKKEMVDAMLNAPMPSNRGSVAGNELFDHPRGLDVFVSVDKRSGNITSFQHNGAASGARSYVMRLTEENITFALLVNTLPTDPGFDYIVAGNLSKVARAIRNWPLHDLFP
eukprot:PITA_20429